jgi:phenylacetate-CoA ligase
VAKDFRRRFQVVDHDELVRLYPPPPEYFEGRYQMEPDAIEAMQLARLKEEAWRASTIPFYKRLWDGAGFSPGDLRSLDDLRSAPIYDIDDIRASLALAPPYGDYQGVSIEDARFSPLRLFWSGGTTGRARPTIYTEWDRQVASITVARALYLHGIRPGDVVLNCWAFSTHTGAFAFDEGLHNWLNCVDITAGTGNVTPTKLQLELAREYEVSSILTMPDYLLHLADVAVQLGMDPKKDFKLRTLPTPGQNPKVSEVWGVPTYDSYGTHEVQYVSMECPERGGLHINEDAFVVEIVDPETKELLPDGERGNIVYTCLYKTGSPQFRFDTQDLSALYPRERCACGSWLRKMDYFRGRSDTMVKLRGLNVWPEDVGRIVCEDDRVLPDWFVRVEKRGNRDEMIVQVETRVPADAWPTLTEELEDRLRSNLEIKILVEPVAPGTTDADTGKGMVGKLRRIRDDRPKQ